MPRWFRRQGAAGVALFFVFAVAPGVTQALDTAATGASTSEEAGEVAYDGREIKIAYNRTKFIQRLSRSHQRWFVYDATVLGALSVSLIIAIAEQSQWSCDPGFGECHSPGGVYLFGLGPALVFSSIPAAIMHIVPGSAADRAEQGVSIARIAREARTAAQVLGFLALGFGAGGVLAMVLSPYVGVPMELLAVNLGTAAFAAFDVFNAAENGARIEYRASGVTVRF